jgi:hypothetical protein
MRQLSLLLLLSFTALAAFGQTPVDTPEVAANKRVDVAKQELDKVSNLVQDGALPRIRQEQAELDVADAQDDAILARTLYGEMPLNEVNDKLLEDMVSAAQRRVERQQVRVDLAKKLVADGVTAQSSVTPLEQELSMRRMNLNLAHSRARLMGELAAMAKYEAAAREIQEVTRIEYRDYFTKGMEHYEGSGTFLASHDLKPLEVAYEKKFDRALPISANGETDLHRSMGFDHAGRVDVAVNPGAPEGVWLRRYLKSRGIPYYAFTRAMRGKATAAHIHIGPGSTRLHNAD